MGELAGGRQDAFASLVEAVYSDLHAIAEGRLRPRFGDRLRAMTISPTVLAHDAAMALLEQRTEWKNRDQFFALATRLMIRMITDYQRARLAQKRGGGRRGAPLDEIDPATPTTKLDTDLDSTLRTIETLHDLYPRKAEVVTLHVVGGHPLPRIAEMVGVSLPTVERDWRFAKAWLADRLSEGV